MATFEVTIETINVFPHPNADRLELAQVGLYNIVVAKGIYATGDRVLYIPEYAVLPEWIIQALNLEGKLAGSHSNRVKPVRLRGEISQGLVMPLSFLPKGEIEGVTDYAEILGIHKYEPPIPVHMAGDVKGSTDLVNWIDIENIKKFPDMFTKGDQVHISEKIHGTASLFSFLFHDNEPTEALVSSKGLGSKSLTIKEDEKNLYWRALKLYNLTGFAEYIRDNYKINDQKINKLAIFGETFGAGVQDLNYGFINKLGFAIFDAFITTENNKELWLNPVTLNELAEDFGVPTVPTMFVGDYSLDKVIELAYGKETISGKNLHVREGVVIRPLERVEGYSNGSKQIAKYVSDDYLLRKNGTEYS